jgi:hypothetical protein
VDKDNPSCWYGLTLTLEAIAQIHAEAGDQTAARHDYDEALQEIIKAGELNTKEKKYSDERASIETKLRQLAPH